MNQTWKNEKKKKKKKKTNFEPDFDLFWHKFGPFFIVFEVLSFGEKIKNSGHKL